MPGDTSASYVSAVHDFRRARRRADMQEVMARLKGRSVELLSYDEVRKKLRAVEGSGARLEDIPLDAIVGSVGRYNDFTRSFLPRMDRGRARWARVKTAVTGMAGVPPIEVYQIGDVYFVRDGHHRVSVARDLAATHIQAYVTPAHSKVPLSPDVEPDGLILKAEYAEFLERTHLDELRPQADLSVTVAGQYPILEEHINVHRYFMGLEQRRDIAYEETLTHWFDAVYLPVVHALRERGILRDFPDRTEADLYLWLAEHRAALEEELGWQVRPEAAVADLAARFSRQPRRVAARVRETMLDALTPDELEAGPQPGQWRRDRIEGSHQETLLADILVAVDGKEGGWHALDLALELARREAAQLHGLHVVPGEGLRRTEEAQALQADFNSRCQAAGVPGRLAVDVGEVARKVCERSRWADLVVLSLACPPAPQPVSRLSSGLSTIIRRCPRPVLTVPIPSSLVDCVGPAPATTRPSSDLSRALLAYDASPKAVEALFVATYLAGAWDMPLVVATVLEGHRATRATLKRAREYLERHSVQVTYVEASGPVGEAILKIADEYKSDLTIMGGYGHTPVLEVFLGSAVDQVLRSGQQPVLICR